MSLSDWLGKVDRVVYGLVAEILAPFNGPKIGSIACFPITSTSQNFALPTGWGSLPSVMVEVPTGVVLFYAWGDSDDVVDDTATSGATQCLSLTGPVRITCRAQGTHLVAKVATGATTGTVRVAAI